MKGLLGILAVVNLLIFTSIRSYAQNNSVEMLVLQNTQQKLEKEQQQLVNAKLSALELMKLLEQDVKDSEQKFKRDLFFDSLLALSLVPTSGLLMLGKVPDIDWRALMVARAFGITLASGGVLLVQDAYYSYKDYKEFADLFEELSKAIHEADIDGSIPEQYRNQLLNVVDDLDLAKYRIEKDLEGNSSDTVFKLPAVVASGILAIIATFNLVEDASLIAGGAFLQGSATTFRLLSMKAKKRFTLNKEVRAYYKEKIMEYIAQVQQLEENINQMIKEVESCLSVTD